MWRCPDKSLLPDLRIVDYESKYECDCIRLFDSNVGHVFVPRQVRHLLEFLGSDKCHFVLVQLKEQVVACGGIEIHGDQNENVLCFGIVDRAYQKRGLGTLLVYKRLSLIDDTYNRSWVHLETNSKSCGFYERFGFRRHAIEKDWYGPGMHSISYGLVLSPVDKTFIRKTVVDFERRAFDTHDGC